MDRGLTAFGIVIIVSISTFIIIATLDDVTKDKITVEVAATQLDMMRLAYEMEGEKLFMENSIHQIQTGSALEIANHGFLDKESYATAEKSDGIVYWKKSGVSRVPSLSSARSALLSEIDERFKTVPFIYASNITLSTSTSNGILTNVNYFAYGEKGDASRTSRGRLVYSNLYGNESFSVNSGLRYEYIHSAASSSIGRSFSPRFESAIKSAEDSAGIDNPVCDSEPGKPTDSSIISKFSSILSSDMSASNDLSFKVSITDSSISSSVESDGTCTMTKIITTIDPETGEEVQETETYEVPKYRRVYSIIYESKITVSDPSYKMVTNGEYLPFDFSVMVSDSHTYRP